MSAGSDKALGRQLGWLIDDTSRPFESRWFSLRSDDVRFPDGSRGAYSYVEHPGAVFVVPLLADGRTVLIRSYRYPIDGYCWEVPAGAIEPGQPPAEAAARELREEIGATPGSLEFITRQYIANGFAHCAAHFFLARDVVLDRDHEREPGELITEIDTLPLEDAIRRVTGADQDGDSALALLLAARTLSGGAS